MLKRNESKTTEDHRKNGRKGHATYIADSTPEQRLAKIAKGLATRAATFATRRANGEPALVKRPLTPEQMEVALSKRRATEAKNVAFALANNIPPRPRKPWFMTPEAIAIASKQGQITRIIRKAAYLAAGNPPKVYKTPVRTPRTAEQIAISADKFRATRAANKAAKEKTIADATSQVV